MKRKSAKIEQHVTVLLNMTSIAFNSDNVLFLAEGNVSILFAVIKPGPKKALILCLFANIEVFDFPFYKFQGSVFFSTSSNDEQSKVMQQNINNSTVCERKTITLLFSACTLPYLTQRNRKSREQIRNKRAR